MKKLLTFSMVALLMGLGLGRAIFGPVRESDDGGERRILYYRDPMNPQNTSALPKKAPDGMDFVPVYDDESAVADRKKILYYRDPMHPWYTSDKPGKAPDCGMDLVPVYEAGGDGGIRIDPMVIQNIGVKTETVRVRRLTRDTRTVGKVEYDETKIYSINTKINGWIEKLYVDYTGRYVKRGDPLFELYSPELLSAQQEYLQALQYRKEMKGSLADLQKSSDDLLLSSRRKLQYWDIPDTDIQALEQRGELKKTMTIYAPYSGVVVEKTAYEGQKVMAGMELFRIVDLATVWIQAEVYQDDVPWVKLGQSANIEVSYLPGRQFSGRVSFIYPMLNLETRTVKVRIEAANTSAVDLKPEMFVTVTLKSPLSVESIAVPEQSVLRSGRRNVVIVARGGGYFDPREVTLGVSAEGYVQILAGLHQDEIIVVSSQFLIDSESNLKSAIAEMAGGADSAGYSFSDTEHIPTADSTMSTGAGDALVYHCPMHAEVQSNKPGECWKCGMRLMPEK